MQKKMTITMDQQVYEGLHTVIGRRNISRFVTALVRPHVIRQNRNTACQPIAADETRLDCWDGFLTALKDVEVPDDFLSDQERMPTAQARDPFSGWHE